MNMQQLEFVDWSTESSKTGDYILLKSTLTDVKFTRIHCNSRTMMPSYGHKTNVTLPFKLNSRGEIVTARVSLPLSVFCVTEPYISKCYGANTRKMFSDGGVHIEISFPTKLEQSTFSRKTKSGNDDVLIVTVYNKSMSDKIKFVVHGKNSIEVSKVKNKNVNKPNIVNEVVKPNPAPVINIKQKKPSITFGKLYADVIVPTKRREDAGLDIYAHFNEEFNVIPPHETAILKTGLVSHFASDWYIQLEERGSTGVLGIAQRAGVIDSGYRGEWNVPLTNTSNKWVVIAKGVNNMDEDGKRYAREYYAGVIGVESNNIILYPYSKAICQAVFHENFDVEVKVDTVDNIQAVPSERGSGKLGSSGK